MNYFKIELIPETVKFIAIPKEKKEKIISYDCYTDKFIDLVGAMCFSFSKVVPETEIEKTKEEKAKAWKEWVYNAIENAYCGHFLNRTTLRKYKGITDLVCTYSFNVTDTRTWKAEQIFKTFTIDQIIEQYGETAYETLKKLK